MIVGIGTDLCRIDRMERAVAGVVSAVLAYYNKFVCPADADVYGRYLLASGAIGGLAKTVTCE